MTEVGYASARAIVREAIPVILPKKIESVAEYALQHRTLTNAGGGYVGRWRHDSAPYLVEPMQCLTSPDFSTIAVVGPGQSGKTSIAENWLLHSVGVNPGKMLWFMQTDEGVSAYVKDRINPMIDAHDVLKSAKGLRSVDDSLHYKRFKAMSIEFLSATASNLINKSAPRLVLDEIDAYDPALGDVMTSANVRRQTFGRQSKIFALSHPDKARGLRPDRDWTAGIMAVYADSDRRMWYAPCRHCEGWSSFCPIAPRVYVLGYPTDGSLAEVRAGAHLVCPINGCAMDESDRLAMNRRGVWIGEGQEISPTGEITGERVPKEIAGFWIVGLMSPWAYGGLGGLAHALEKAKREFEISGEEQSLREVTVKQFGLPYAPPKQVGSIDANDLADRAIAETQQLGVVPDGVRFITIAVDCQIAHFEWLVRGWGVAGESWVIDRGRMPGDPATSGEDWDGLLDLFARAFPLEDGSGRAMTARAAIFDSQGAPGVTHQAYTAWMRWRRLRAIRLFGKISGRDCWSIIPSKGAGPNAPKLQVVYPDTTRKANVVAGAGHVPVAMFNANTFKDDLAGQFNKGEPGPLYVHTPAKLLSKEPPHVWFEQAVAERRDAKGRWERVSPSARNEALDLLVMTHVAAHLHGLSRINWERPPSWALPWDENATVVASSPAAAEPVRERASAPIKLTTPAKPKSADGGLSSFIDKFK